MTPTRRAYLAAVALVAAIGAAALAIDLAARF